MESKGPPNPKPWYNNINAYPCFLIRLPMCTRMLSSLYFVFDPRLICTHCMKHLVLSAPGPLVSLLLILVVLAPHGVPN